MRPDSTPQDTARPILLKDYRPTDYLIGRVELAFSLKDHATKVVSKLFLRPNPAGRAGAALILDGDGLRPVSVKLDGVFLPLSMADADRLVLENPPQREFVLETETLLDPKANSQLMGLYRTGSSFCTQCEAEGFRRITYFYDRPDVLSVYTVRIEADTTEAPVLLSNGNLVEKGDLPDGRHFALWHDPFPKPAYLFALVGGQLDAIFDDFVTKSGRKVRLGIYTEPKKAERAYYAMDSLKRSMAWDERVFGREYDLDIFNIVAVSDFNMGAMENKGLNVFNDKYVLASPETATDADYAGIEAVIAHEYFHNWTGNRITCRDWFQLCLKEGLTVFRDQEFSSDERSRAVKRIADVKRLRSTQFVEDAGPLAHNVRPESYMEINNFYTSTIYEKGAEVVRMLKTLTGDAAFRAGMDLYFERFDGTAATMEDFISCFAEAAKADLTQFMRWYEQAGTPRVKITTEYDAGTQTFAVNLAQHTPSTPGQATKCPVVIPVRLGLVGVRGDLELRTKDAKADQKNCCTLKFETETTKICFQNVTERPVLSAFRGFSAPVRVDFDQPDEDLLLLARRDSDTFNRWQALQTCATRLLIRAAQNDGPTEHSELAAAYSEIITAASAPEADHAFAALALQLPGEADIGREIGVDVNPDAIRLAREAFKANLSSRISAAAERLYHELAQPRSFVPDAAGAGRRALMGVLLDLLTAGGAPDAAALARRQFEGADNMTDRMNALVALVHVGGEAREMALSVFYSRYKNEPLIIDQWFSLQAMIGEITTLARIEHLIQHEAFSFANPNRVRSLIGAFAMSNPTQFNRADGAGYDFVTGIVAQLDKKNPQVAARLLSAFRAWRTFEPQRQQKAEQALRLLGTAAELSADVRDIVTRSLA